MATLVINKGYAARAVLTEAHIDAFRTGLLSLLNTDKLGSTNFTTGISLTSAKFIDSQLLAADNDYIFFGSNNDAKFGIDASKRLVFDTTSTTTTITLKQTVNSLHIKTDKIILAGHTLVAAGGANFGIQPLLSLFYRKPVLEFLSTTEVTLESNYDSSTSLVHFPSFTTLDDTTVNSANKYRYATVSTTANGYGTADIGAAKGGMRSGLTVTANNWYYVYYAKVRSGTDYSATTAKAVIVFDTTSPEAANEATLNTRYGTDCWVYLGLIRYGYGATGATTGIIKFKQSNKGRCYLYGKGTGYAGFNLAYNALDTDDTTTPLYTIAAGTSGNVVPSIISAGSYNVVRENVSDWYVQDTANKIIWRGGWQSDDSLMEHGHYVELPNVVGLDFCQTRLGAGAVAKAVVLVGFVDPYVCGRRMIGKG